MELSALVSNFIYSTNTKCDKIQAMEEFNSQTTPTTQEKKPNKEIKSYNPTHPDELKRLVEIDEMRATEKIYNNKFSFTKAINFCLNSEYGLITTLNSKYAKNMQFYFVKNRQFFKGHLANENMKEEIKTTHSMLLAEILESNKINDIVDIPHRLQKVHFITTGSDMFSPCSGYNFERTEFLYNFCDDTKKATNKILENERINKTL